MLKYKIEVFLLTQKMMTNTKIKIKITHHCNTSVHLSFRSESKIGVSMLGESPGYIQYNDRRPQTVYLHIYYVLWRLIYTLQPPIAHVFLV